jgi:hypothetical protein
MLASDTYRNLEDQLLAVVLGLNGVENGGKLLTIELHCSSKSDIVVSDRYWVVVDGCCDEIDSRKDFRAATHGQGLSGIRGTYRRRRHQ